MESRETEFASLDGTVLIQAAPYAVAELRLHEALRTRFETEVPRAEMRFLTDALENPVQQQQRLPAPYRVIGEARDEANRVKRDQRVMVVIGNPPHVEGTKGKAPWVEARRTSAAPKRRRLGGAVSNDRRQVASRTRSAASLRRVKVS